MKIPPAPDIIELPISRWRESRALRLHALRADPAAFASSHADESAFADDIWLRRAQSAIDRKGNMTFYAEVAGKLVGMAVANWSDREKIRHVANVYGMYAHPDYRGQGIAKSLMTRLLDELDAMPQIRKVSLQVNRESAAAVALYEKMGFETVGVARGDLFVGGRYVDLLYMEKKTEPPSSPSQESSPRKIFVSFVPSRPL